MILHQRVVAVCVGTPRTVPWRGRMVSTSIFKEAVVGPVVVDAAGVAGDRQADLLAHGGPAKAVYAYPIEHYDFWRRQIPDVALEPGAFGENLTVAGLNEHELQIGDRLRVGTAELVVGEPRTPCYKLGIRLDRDDAVARFVAAERSGWYMSVARAGELWAGAPIELIDRGREDAPTVAEAFRLSVRPTRDDLPALREAVARELVPEDLRVQLARQLRRLTDPERPAWLGFRPFRVASKTRESDDVVSLLLRPADGKPLPSFAAGQHVPVCLEGLADGTAPVYRCYSLSDSPSRQGWRLTVKRAPEGGGGPSASAYIHGRLAVGDVLGLGAPRGRFTLAAAAPKSRLVFVAAGIGVTPILAMLKALVETRDSRETTLVYGLRSGEEVVAREELRELARAGVQTHLVFSRQPDETAIPEAQSHRGRVTPSLLRELLPEPAGDAFLCGPRAMIDELTSAAEANRWPAERVHVERFGATASLQAPPIAPDEGLEVTFAHAARTALWADPSDTVLDLADQAGVTVDSACRAGSCGTCRLRVLDGHVAYRDPPAVPLDDDECLSCIAVPTTRLTVAA